MKKLFTYFLLPIAFCLLLVSCRVGKITCKHQSMKPVVFLKDDGTSYTVNVPFCDTVLITPKEKKLSF